MKIMHPSPFQAEGKKEKKISGNLSDLRNSSILYDPLHYYEHEDSELSEEIVKQYRKANYTTLELIDQLTHAQNSEYKAENEQSLRISILQAMISKELGLPILGHVGYFVDCVHEILKLMQRDLIEVARIHRHKTILGLYTEKGVY